MSDANKGRSTLRGRRGLIAATVAAGFLSITAVHAVEAVPGGYSPDVAYGRGSLVVGSDGNVYRALDAVKAKDPVAAKDATWQLAHVAFDTTLDVPGRFDSIEKAFAFLAGVMISDAATVTVQVAPGTYEMKGPLSIGHSHGRRVVLRGGKDPAKTTFGFSGGGGIVVDNARNVRIEGVTIQGGRKDQVGLLIDNGSSVILVNVKIDGFDLGILADNGAELSAEDVAVTTESGGWGIKLDSLSRGLLKRCRTVRTKPDVAGGRSFGIDVENGATVECRDCYSSGWMIGFMSGRSGSMEVWNSEALGNVWGANVYLNATLSMLESTLQENTERGLATHGGTVMLVDCKIRDNKKMGITAHAGGLVDFMGTPCLISGHERALRSEMGGRFHGTTPTWKNNEEDLSVTPASGTDKTDIFILK